MAVSSHGVRRIANTITPYTNHAQAQLTTRVPGQAHSPALSVVVPVFNEADGVTEFHRRLVSVLNALCQTSEIIYVNDGSSDDSYVTLCELHEGDGRVAIVNLSRNFGKEVAVTAGLDHSLGAAAIVIDADLQDPPEVIPLLVHKWQEGFDMVSARRRERRGETWLKRTTATLFYQVMNRIGETSIPRDTGDFRLLSRRCLDALSECRERRRFMKGLFAWVGFRHAEVLYDRDPRFAGETKWSYWRLWNFAIEGITSFTIAPLKLATYIGLMTAFIAVTYAAAIVVRTLAFGRVTPGYASLMVVILLVSGVQLVAMGVIGEYIGRIFVESKNRPLYVLDEYHEARAFTSEE